MNATAHPDHDLLRLGDLRLRSGDTLPDARLAYRTWGRLNGARDNCIVIPTAGITSHRSIERLLGPGRALDPAEWFIVVPNLFGNGISSSPGNTRSYAGHGPFPRITVLDNVICQYRLLTEHLGVRGIALTTGWGLGGMQAIHWATLFPDMVARLLPVCSAARCPAIARVFIAAVRACLKAPGHGSDAAEPGLRAAAHVWAGWAYSPAFFRKRLHEVLGHGTSEELLTAWEREFFGMNPDDLLATLWTWADGDVGANDMYRGNHMRALGSIRARTIMMPCDQDMLFPLEDALLEMAQIPDAELRPLRSDFGHSAGAPGRFPEETAYFEAAVRDLLAR